MMTMFSLSLQDVTVGNMTEPVYHSSQAISK